MVIRLSFWSEFTFSDQNLQWCLWVWWLQGFGEDQVGALLVAYLEGAGAGFEEAVAAVEGDGAEVSGVCAEQQPGTVEGARVGDGGVHEGLGGAKVGDERAGGVRFCERDDGRGAEAGEEVDALELDVRRKDGDGGKIGSAEHGVADGCAGFVREAEGRAGEGEGDAGVGVGDGAGVGVSGVVFQGVGDDVGAGEHPGEGFEEGGGAEERERGCVGECGAAEGDGLDGVGCEGLAGGIGGHDFSRVLMVAEMRGAGGYQGGVARLWVVLRELFLWRKKWLRR
jgi:hypothetical protein